MRVREVASALALVGAALLPKCPLCIAAFMCALGISGVTAFEVAPFVRGGALALAAFSMVAVIAVERRRRACATRSQRLCNRQACTTAMP
jgi:hypothetical protein